MISGFEVQIDDNALGDSTKDFYGISPEPNGLWGGLGIAAVVAMLSSAIGLATGDAMRKVRR